MALVTAGDIQLALAYRLGEDSAPNDANEKARRLSFINEGYRGVMAKNYWWFTEASTTLNSLAGQESYGTSDGVPDFRQILEFRFNGIVYSQITQYDAMTAYSTSYSNFVNSYFLFNGKIYPVPAISTSVTNGIALKYYQNYTKLTGDASTILIPDLFSDILVAYAQARVTLVDGERGSASDSFDEYNEILGRMVEEQNKYLFSLKDGGNVDSVQAQFP